MVNSATASMFSSIELRCHRWNTFLLDKDTLKDNIFLNLKIFIFE